MKIQDIQFLFEYNYWARDRILESVAKLSPQQFIEPRTCDHGSIRNTLVHILSAEWVWRMRCQEHISPTELLAFDDFLSPETLQARWQQEEARMRSYLYGLRAQELDRVVRYNSPFYFDELEWMFYNGVTFYSSKTSTSEYLRKTRKGERNEWRKSFGRHTEGRIYPDGRW